MKKWNADADPFVKLARAEKARRQKIVGDVIAAVIAQYREELTSGDARSGRRRRKGAPGAPPTPPRGKPGHTLRLTKPAPVSRKAANAGKVSGKDPKPRRTAVPRESAATIAKRDAELARVREAMPACRSWAEVAQAVKLPARTLRRWRELGLLPIELPNANAHSGRASASARRGPLVRKRRTR